MIRSEARGLLAGCMLVMFLVGCSEKSTSSVTSKESEQLPDASQKATAPRLTWEGLKREVLRCVVDQDDSLPVILVVDNSDAGYVTLKQGKSVGIYKYLIAGADLKLTKDVGGGLETKTLPTAIANGEMKDVDAGRAMLFRFDGGEYVLRPTMNRQEVDFGKFTITGQDGQRLHVVHEKYIRLEGRLVKTKRWCSMAA